MWCTTHHMRACERARTLRIQFECISLVFQFFLSVLFQKTGYRKSPSGRFMFSFIIVKTFFFREPIYQLIGENMIQSKIVMHTATVQCSTLYSYLWLTHILHIILYWIAWKLITSCMSTAKTKKTTSIVWQLRQMPPPPLLYAHVCPQCAMRENNLHWCRGNLLIDSKI